METKYIAQVLLKMYKSLKENGELNDYSLDYYLQRTYEKYVYNCQNIFLNPKTKGEFLRTHFVGNPNIYSDIMISAFTQKADLLREPKGSAPEI